MDEESVQLPCIPPGTACSHRLPTQPAASQAEGHWVSPGQRPQQVAWRSLNLRVTVAMMALRQHSTGCPPRLPPGPSPLEEQTGRHSPAARGRLLQRPAHRNSNAETLKGSSTERVFAMLKPPLKHPTKWHSPHRFWQQQQSTESC